MAEHEQIKERIRAAWSLGDYAPIARMLLPAAQDLLDACAISAGQEILDVGAGTGNLALLAAEEGASVVASDLSERQVESGRERTGAAGVDVEWVVADVEELPFDDGRFDCAASVFGAIFAPRPEVAVGELFRVVRPGGTVGLTAWGDYGPQAEIFGLFDELRPPSSAPPPSQWGDEAVVQERLAPHAARTQLERTALHYEFDSFDDMWSAFSANGPLVAIERSQPPERFAELRDAVEAVVARHNKASDGRVVIDADYLRIVARKRG